MGVQPPTASDQRRTARGGRQRPGAGVLEPGHAAGLLGQRHHPGDRTGRTAPRSGGTPGSPGSRRPCSGPPRRPTGRTSRGPVHSSRARMGGGHVRGQGGVPPEHAHEPWMGRDPLHLCRRPPRFARSGARPVIARSAWRGRSRSSARPGRGSSVPPLPCGDPPARTPPAAVAPATVSRHVRRRPGGSPPASERPRCVDGGDFLEDGLVQLRQPHEPARLRSTAATWPATNWTLPSATALSRGCLTPLAGMTVVP